uniref:TLC domain-containing protein n=1 Tax=viral metagenome TaxID=1070528 RepID=A0A6C0JP85_9ZZZZ
MDPRILYSLQSAVLFFIIASPYMYSLTKKLIKLDTYGSVALHSVVFGLIVYMLMIIQK